MALNKHYFRHDFDASEDEKLFDIIVNFGNEGYGLYWRLIESLYKLGGFLEYKSKNLAHRFDTTVEIFNQFIDACIESELLQIEDGHVTSKRVKFELSKLNELIDKRKTAGKLGGIKKKENQVDASKCLASAKQMPSKPLAPLSNIILSNTDLSIGSSTSIELNNLGSNQDPKLELVPINQDKKIKKSKPPKELKNTYGPTQHVFLTEKEYNDLLDLCDGNEALRAKTILKLDGSESIDNKKSHYRCAISWGIDAARKELSSNARREIENKFGFVPSAAERANMRTAANVKSFLNGEPTIIDKIKNQKRIGEAK